MALSVMAVSTSVSPFLMDEEDTDMFMTSAPSRLPASSNEDWVRVDASKKRFTWVRPRRTVRFLSTWRLSSTYSSDRSRRPVMSAAERPSMPSKCRWPRTKVDFDVIKARAIGGDGRGGKGQSPGGELSPDLSVLSLWRELSPSSPSCPGLSRASTFLRCCRRKGEDGRDKPGHDDWDAFREINSGSAPGAHDDQHRPRPIASRRFRLFARHRPQHHPGHPLRHLEQFRRPSARRLRRRRMRGEAGDWAAVEGGAAGTGGTKSLAENVRLLPAGAGLARHGQVVAERPGDGCRAALQSQNSQDRAVPPRLHRKPLAAFDGRRARSHAGRSQGGQFRQIRPVKGLRRLYRAGRGAPARGQCRHGHRLRLYRRERAHRRANGQSGPARLAQAARGCDGEARLCELCEGVVALFTAGGGRGGL